MASPRQSDLLFPSSFPFIGLLLPVRLRDSSSEKGIDAATFLYGLLKTCRCHPKNLRCSWMGHMFGKVQFALAQQPWLEVQRCARHGCGYPSLPTICPYARPYVRNDFAL